MHPCKIVAQISLILSILNLILAAPIVVQEIHYSRGDETVVAEDVPALSKKSDELEAASDTPTSPPPFPGAMASPQHSPLSDGSTSSGYPVPHLSSDSSDSGYSWLLDRPPRLSPNLPASLHESAPHASSLGSPEIPLPALLHGLGTPHPSEISTPEWLTELEQMLELQNLPSPQHTGSNWATTETSPHSSSLSSTDWDFHESVPTPHSLASDGLVPSPPPTEIPPDNAGFFNKNMMKKLKIVAGVVIVGGVIGGIVGSRTKHRDRD
jgi:hypothetical protein